MKQRSITKDLQHLKIKSPNFIYNVLGTVWKILFKKKYNIHVEDKVTLKNIKGPYILISNHASRLDYMYIGLPLLPARLNFVAGYNEFFRSHLQGVFKILQVIPKKNFTSDVNTIKQISRVLKNNGKVMIFPEGMSSISGANQPIVVGTGKFIKHFNVPVYYAVIKGGYLTSPKYNLDERPGRVDVTFDSLFTVDDIQKLSAEEIEDCINEAIYHDDYEWNKVNQYSYKVNENFLKDIGDLLFICPKCKSEFTITSTNNTIKCSHCGNKIDVDDKYMLLPHDETSVVPSTQTEWFNMQREIIKKQILDENYKLEEIVDLGMLDDEKYLKNQATSNIVGVGRLTFDHTGLTYNGIKNNKPFSFHINTSDLPTFGMCTDLSRFYTFYQGTFYEFYPKTRCVEKWFLVAEEMHRLNGGKWQDFKFTKKE